MRVTLVADSCFLFEHAGIRLLTDPWIGTAIAGGAWIQYPRPVITAEQVGRLDYIFISHIHEDHCDLPTLRALDRNARIILMDRRPNFVENFLRYHRLQFREVINIPLRKHHDIGNNMSFEVVEADPAHTLNHLVDSALLIHYDGKSIYFANDNPPYAAIDEYLKRYRFELALLPPVGGSGYPAFYDSLSDDRKRIRANEIIQGYHEELLQCLRRLKPRLFGCAANGHVLSGENAHLNEFMSWPQSACSPYRYVSERLTTADAFRPILLQPGDSTTLETDAGADFDAAARFYDNRAARAEFIRTKAREVPYVYQSFQLNPSISFPRLIELAYPRMKSYLERARVNVPYQYVFPYPQDKYASVKLSPPHDLNLDAPLVEDDRLVVSVEPRILYMLLTGGFSWNIADATGFIRYDRRPDSYIYDMYIALNHFRI
jgi:UDP-MurNAc hydroxylase